MSGRSPCTELLLHRKGTSFWQGIEKVSSSQMPVFDPVNHFLLEAPPSFPLRGLHSSICLTLPAASQPGSQVPHILHTSLVKGPLESLLGLSCLCPSLGLSDPGLRFQLPTTPQMSTQAPGLSSTLTGPTAGPTQRRRNPPGPACPDCVFSPGDGPHPPGPRLTLTLPSRSSPNLKIPQCYLSPPLWSL